MNKKQLVCMWLGIIFIACPMGLMGLAGGAGHASSKVILSLVLWSLAVLLVTAGLIYTFKDKPKDNEKEKDKK